MAVLTAQSISSLSVSLLTRSLVLPNTVSRIPGGEFAGSNGDTITVRVRQPRSASVQANPGDSISFSSIDETSVQVSLTHLYDGVNVTDEEMSLELVDFGTQVTQPQVQAIAMGAEEELATSMNGLAADGSFALDATADDTEAQILAAREALSAANVPAGERSMAVSPEIATRVLSVPKFVRVDESGADSALRQAVIGRLYGFQFVESNALTSGTAVAYHRSGFAFANRTPMSPRGLGDGQTSTATSGGVSMRHIFQYNAGTLTDQSVLSTFAGANVVEADRVFKLDTATA